jgi:plastocyanin
MNVHPKNFCSASCLAYFCICALFLSLTLACSKGVPPVEQASAAPSSQALPIDPTTVASVSGNVTFAGAPPKATRIDMSNDPGCKGENQSEQVVIDDGHLANVLVYVKDGLNARSFDAPQQVMTVKQEGCRYVPHVAAVMVGQPVNFVDEDHTEHNIHPSPKNNPEWNQSQSPNSAPVDKSFHNPEIMMPIKCNQHPWMKMYLSVIGNPYFAVTGKDGSFRLTGLPPGTYTIAAIHEKYGEQDQTITVGPKQDKTGIEFSYKE